MIKKIIFIMLLINFCFVIFASDYNHFYSLAKDELSKGNTLNAIEHIKAALLFNPDSEEALNLYIELITQPELILEEKKSRDESIIKDELKSVLPQQFINLSKNLAGDNSLDDYRKIFHNVNYKKHDDRVNGIYKLEFIPHHNKSEIIITGAAKFDYLISRLVDPPMLVIDLPNTTNFLPLLHPVGKFDINYKNIKAIRHSQFRVFPVPTTRVVVDIQNWNMDYEVDYLADNIISVSIIPKDNKYTSSLTEEDLLEKISISEKAEAVAKDEDLEKTTDVKSEKNQDTELKVLLKTFQQKLKVLSPQKINLHAGAPLSMPFVVQVLDKDNNPLPSIPVEFILLENKKIRITDQDGIIEFDEIELPVESGNYKLEMRLIESDWSEHIDIHISAGQPANINIISGDYQKIYLSSVIDEPLVVKVTDKYDNPVKDAKVYFSIASGSGEIDINPANPNFNEVIAQTDRYGFARCDYYLTGFYRGYNVIKASIIIDEPYEKANHLIMTASSNLSEAMRDLMQYIESPNIDVNLLIFEAAEGINFNKLKSDIFVELTPSGKLRDFPQYNSLFISDETANLTNMLSILNNYSGIKITAKTLRSVNFTVEAIPRLVSIDFINANLSDVLRTLAELGDWNISYPDLTASYPVNVHLKDVPALLALDTILENQGLTRIQDGNLIKIIWKDEAKAKGMETTMGIIHEELPEGDHFITHVVHLDYAAGDIIMRALDPLRSPDGIITYEDSSNSLIITESVSNIRRFLKIIIEFDRVAKQTAMGETPYLEMYHLSHEQPSVIKDKLDILLKEIRETQERSRGTADQAAARSRSADASTQQTGMRFSELEQFAIIPHDDKGVLIVYTTSHNHNNIKEILRVVDRPIDSTIKVFNKEKDLAGQDPMVLKEVLENLRSVAANQTSAGRYIPMGGIYSYEYHTSGEVKRAFIRPEDEDPRKYVIVATANTLAIIGDPAALRDFTRIVEDISKENIELTSLKEPLNELRVYKLEHIKAIDAQNYLLMIEKVVVQFSKVVINNDLKENLYIIADPEIHNRIERIINNIDVASLSDIFLYSNVNVLDKEKDLKGNDPELIATIIYDMKTLKENQNELGDFIPYGGIKEIRESIDESRRQIRTSKEEIVKDPRQYNLIFSEDNLAIIADPEILRTITRTILDIVNANIDLEKLRAHINIVTLYDLNYIEPEDFINYLRNVENLAFPFAQGLHTEDKKRVIIIAEEAIHIRIKRIVDSVDIPDLQNINLFTNVRVFDRVNDLSNNSPENLRDIILTMPSLNSNRDNSGRYVEPGARQRVYDDEDNFIREDLIDPREYQLIASNEQLILLAPPEPLREISKTISDIIIADIDIDELRVPLREFQNYALKHITGMQALNYLSKIENKVFDYIADAGTFERQSITVIGSREELIDVQRIIDKIDTPEFANLNFKDNLTAETIRFDNISINSVKGLFEKDKSIGMLLSADGSIFVNEFDNSIIVNDVKVNVDRIRELCNNYDVPFSSITEIIKLHNIEVISLKNMLGENNLFGRYLTDNGSIAISNVRNAVIINDHPFAIRKIKEIIKELDEYDSSKDGWIETKTFYLKHARAARQIGVSGDFGTLVSEGIEERLKDLLEEDIQLANESKGKLFGIVTTDERTNSVTVISTRKDMNIIQQIIKSLDVAPTQVLIEAKIVERTISSGEAFGINWAQGFNKAVNTSLNATESARRSGAGIEFSPGTIDGSFTGTLSSGQFRIMLEALERSQSADVLSRPNVFTMNNIPANISVIQKVPYVTSLRDADGFVSTTQEVVDVPIELKILPQIGNNRTIQLNINIDVSKAEPTPSGNRPPVSQRNLNTRVLVADGQTVILGGIFIDNQQSDNSFLPGTKSLRRIPVIGGAFGRKAVERLHTELLLFVTPKIVDSPIEVEQLKDEFIKKFDEISEKELNFNTSSTSDIVDYYLVMIMPDLQKKHLDKIKMTSGFAMKRGLPQWLRDDAFSLAFAKSIEDYKKNYNIPFISLDDISKLILDYNGSRRPISYFDGLLETLLSNADIMVNVNVVTVEDFVQLPHIDYNIAHDIVNLRRQIRYFTSLDTVEEYLLNSGIRQDYYDNYLKEIFTIGIQSERSYNNLIVNHSNPATQLTSNIQRFNINTVSENDLKNELKLSDIDSKLIVAYRNRYGGFESIDELKNIPYMNTDKFNNIKNYFYISK